MKVTRYRKSEKDGYLMADFSVLVDTEFGEMEINACKYFVKDGQRWVNLPSSKIEKDGQVSFFDFCYMKTGKEKFRNACMSEIDKFCVEAGISMDPVPNHVQQKIHDPMQSNCVLRATADVKHDSFSGGMPF